LPAPREARFPVHGVNVPARTVSGDFFDYLTPAPGRIVFCLGDVSGKGMNAALLMAKTASLFRCLAKSIAGPGALLARLNDEICETATRGMFVTMAAGLYDVASGALRLANAGHEPPLQRRPDGRYASLPAEAPPLGIVPGSEFPEREVSLDGGCLYVFSDGLTEARDAAGRELGAAGFRRLADRHAALPLRERVEAIAAEVSALELRDDLTLLGVCHGAG
jgi:sigma-B regulation protein RsbU (phosphoserine phosphatase)